MALVLHVQPTAHGAGWLASPPQGMSKSILIQSIKINGLSVRDQCSQGLPEVWGVGANIGQKMIRFRVR